MHRFRLVLALTLLWSLAGCANLLSIHRQQDVTPTAVAGQSVKGAQLTLIDAKQRALVTLQRGDKTVICAEPSPDALQAVAASTALSTQSADDRLTQIANSLSEATSNIGLRTQSIQLLRDAMYRICEGYAGHAIDDDEVTTLHRRYQNLMLGLLAIEQLTGAVATSQVALFTNGAATAGAAASELAALQQKLKGEQDSLADARKLVQVAQGQLDTIEGDINAANGELSKLKETDTEKVTALKTKLADLRAKRVEKRAEVDSLAAKEKNQANVVKSVADALQAASARVTATTGAQAAFDGKQGRGMTDPATAGAVADAVQGIVAQVVTTSFLHEACFGYVEKMLNAKKTTTTPSQFEAIVKISNACMENVAAQLARNTEMLRGETELLRRKKSDSSTSK